MKMVKRMSKPFTKVVLFVLVIGLLAGCTVVKEPSQSSNTVVDTSNEKEEVLTFPLVEPVTLTYWVPLAAKSGKWIARYEEMGQYIELEKRTNVKISFIHPTAGQTKEQFNLMIASGEYPDIIDTNLSNYKGGPMNAIKQKVFMPLNDLMPKYTPNLSRLYELYPEFGKLAKTDEGDYYHFPMIRALDTGLTFNGPFVRKDWLEDLGLEEPETIDDWTIMLKAFKDKKGAEAPITMLLDVWTKSHSFVSAYGVGARWYQDDGVAKYGPYEPKYKGFVELFNKWFKEDLLDPDFAAQDLEAEKAKLISGVAGAGLSGNGTIASSILAAMVQDPNTRYELKGVPYPVLNKGDKPRFGHKDSPMSALGAAITTQCKNKEVAALYLDYAYGEEGNWLTEWGLEGITYLISDDGRLMEFEDDAVQQEAQQRFFRRVSSGPVMRGLLRGNEIIDMFDPSIYKAGEPTRASTNQKEAAKLWIATTDFSPVMPFVSYTDDESTRMATIMNDIQTHEGETFLKFVMGQRPLDQFDDYLNELKKMNMEEAISMQQAALDRYNSR